MVLFWMHLFNINKLCFYDMRVCLEIMSNICWNISVLSIKIWIRVFVCLFIVLCFMYEHYYWGCIWNWVIGCFLSFVTGKAIHSLIYGAITLVTVDVMSLSHSFHLEQSVYCHINYAVIVFNCCFLIPFLLLFI